MSVAVDISTCGDMCWYVPTCDINPDTSDSDHLDFIYMPYVSICGHADMCWYVPTCDGMCQHMQPLSDTNHLKLILNAGMCQHNWTCWYVLTCADMCRHVPTCDINHDTSYSDHLDLIWMLACVSICGHTGMCWYVPTCAGMCQHAKLLSAPLIPTIWNLSGMLACVSTLDMPIISSLSGRWHVSVSVDIRRHVLICAYMCWHVPRCANMWHYFRHFW